MNLSIKNNTSRYLEIVGDSKTKKKTLFMVILTTIILASCMPLAPTKAYPELTIDIQTLDKKTENELVTFMLNFSLQTETGETANYVQTIGEPWLNAPSSANIIIYLPPNTQKFETPWDSLNYDEPIKVWWYFDNELVETTDNQTAIQKWVEQYAHNSWPERLTFGILSLSNNNTKATIYFSRSTCPECSGGMLLTVQKNDTGTWTLRNSELLWLG